MIHAFCTWSEEFPNALLRDIYIVVHDHAVQPFSDAMKKYISLYFHRIIYPQPVLYLLLSVLLYQIKRKGKKCKGILSTSDEVVTVRPVTTSIFTGDAKPAPIEVCKEELLKQKVVKVLYIK